MNENLKIKSNVNLNNTFLVIDLEGWVNDD
jgi:hypothetical protein